MKKSRIILGFYVGVIALCVATVSMSIAWYASSTQVRLEAIEMTVDCDRDLGISLTRDGEYVEKFEPEDLEQVGIFRPVTSAYSSRWKDTKSDKPIFYDEPRFSTNEITGKVPVEAISGFYSQKFYLKSDDDIYVTIGADNTYINPNYEYNEGYAKELFKEYQKGDDERLKAMTEEEIETGLNNLVKAMRYSILITDEKDYDYAIIDTHKENIVTEYAGLLDVDRDHYYDHFIRGDKSYERFYGDYTGEVLYGQEYDGDSAYKDPDDSPNAFNAKHKQGIVAYDEEASKANGLVINVEESIDVNEFKKDVKPFRIPVYRNQPQEIVLSIYIEGWDLDSINHTKGATFISNLEFKIEREQ